MKTMLTLLLTGLMLCALAPFCLAEGALTLPDALAVIEEEAFCGAANLGCVVLPDGATEIGSRAFADSSLASINLPATLTSIADDAFDGCAATLEVTEGCPAWEWCVAHGLTPVEWTSLEQTGRDSVCLAWSVPEGAAAACDVLMLVAGEWTTVASGLTSGEWSRDGLALGNTLTFALRFTVSQTIADGETTLTFAYTRQTETRTVAVLDCDYSWWIEDGQAILTEAKLWADAATSEVCIPGELDGCPVTRIGPKAFTCLSGMTKVALPDTVTRIDSTAFYGCPDLTSVTMTDSVLTVGDHAFAACPALNDVRLSDSITALGAYAFWNDAALMEIELPTALTSLGRKALYGTGLATVALPDLLTEIGSQAWDDDVTEIITGEQAVSFRAVDGVLYGCGMTELVWMPRSLGLTDYAAPQTVTSIAPFALAGVSTLEAAAFPGGLMVIGDSAFSGCAALANVSGLDGLVSLGDRAFYGCAALTDSGFQSMTALESVGAYAFYGCSALERMPFPATLLWLGEAAFYECTGLTNIRLGDRMNGLGDYAFYGCAALEQVEMPERLTNAEGLGTYLFYGCASLKTFAVPAGTTKIGSHTFYGCSALTTLALPDSLETIGNAACYKCSTLTGLAIPDSVTAIDPYAFTYCKGLTELNLPACSVGSYSFSVCTALRSVTFAAESPTDTQTTLGERAFYYCTKLESALLPANTASISADAFESCAKLTLYVEENSPAHAFAVNNNLAFELIEG